MKLIKFFINIYLKDKVFYTSVCIIFFIFLFSILSSSVTYKTNSKTFIDFSLALSLMFIILKMIYIGCSNFFDDLESGMTSFLIGQGFTRKHYFDSRFIGAGIILFLNVLVLYSINYLIYFYQGGSLNLNSLYLIIGTFLSGLIVYLISFLISNFLNKYLSICLAITIFIFSNMFLSVKESRYFPQGKINEGLNLFHFLIPDFNGLNLNVFINENVIGFSDVVMIFIHGICYIGFLYFLLQFIFKRREIN